MTTTTAHAATLRESRSASVRPAARTAATARRKARTGTRVWAQRWHGLAQDLVRVHAWARLLG